MSHATKDMVLSITFFCLVGHSLLFIFPAFCFFCASVIGYVEDGRL